MGFYINPPEGTKEDWLLRNGQAMISPDWPPPEGQVLVCMVDNGPFRAAGICYDKSEWEEFTAPDSRSKEWYLVPREKILTVCPSVENFLS